MRSRAKMIGAAIGGAAVLASGAYALGAQSGNGNAEAAAKAGAAQTQQGYGPAGAPKRGDCGPRGERRGVRDAALAKKLGVSEAKLRDAMKAVRKELFDGKKPDASKTPAQMRDAFVTALAKELGIDKDKVEAALPKGPADGGPGPMGRQGGPGRPGGPPPGAGYGMPPAPPAAP